MDQNNVSIVMSWIHFNHSLKTLNWMKLRHNFANIRQCSLHKWQRSVHLHHTSVLNNASLCALSIILKVKKKLVQPTANSNWISHLFTTHLFFFTYLQSLFCHATQYFECSFKVKDLIYIFFTYCVCVCTLPDIHIFIHSYILQYDTLLDRIVWRETWYAMTKQVACCRIFKSNAIVCCEIEQACFLLNSAWLGNGQKAIRNRLWHDGRRPKHIGVPHY